MKFTALIFACSADLIRTDFSEKPGQPSGSLMFFADYVGLARDNELLSVSCRFSCFRLSESRR